MRKILFIYLLVVFSLTSLARNGEVKAYCDSVMHTFEGMPADIPRLARLLATTELHQYPPYDLFFATRLYEEAVKQGNVVYENKGAYYLAICYGKKHDADSLQHWVNRLAELAPQVGKLDSYLEQKAALSRVYASEQQVEKAVYVAKEVLETSLRAKNPNGIVAAHNSLACAYALSNREAQARKLLLEAYEMCTPEVKLGLRLDILSRLSTNYGNSSQCDSLFIYLDQMNALLQHVVTLRPETTNNWRNALVDCHIKYVRYYMSVRDFEQTEFHLNEAKALLSPAVDPVFRLNVQLVKMQYLTHLKEYAQSVALIDELLPWVEKKYVSTYPTLVYYKAFNQRGKGDWHDAIGTMRLLLEKQDSLNYAFMSGQLEQVKELYHIDELLLEQQKIANMNYLRIVAILLLLLVIMVAFYLYTKSLSRKITQAEAAAAEAAALSDADNKAKERLKLEISHDIRTPLNAVVGFSEILVEVEDLDEESRTEYNRIIQENAAQLLDYVNNVLELSRLESGKIHYKEEALDLIKLLPQTLATLNGMEGNKVKTLLHTTLDSAFICTDKERLWALFYSLLYTTTADEQTYCATLTVEKQCAKSALLIKVVNTPLAKERFENKTAMIRNEINAHFIHHFGGYYKVNEHASEGPTVIFIYPLA